MRRLLVTGVATIAACVAAGSAAADGYVQLTPIGRVRFPHRSFLLDAPTARVGRGRVAVFENGKRIRPVSVKTIEAVDGRFGVVLLIDASNSMRGAPADAALAAARAFVSRAAASERIGIVTFNGATKILALPTQSTDVLTQALARPLALAGGTRIYDAVDRAIGLLRANHVAAGSIVVLSDGADTGSRQSESEVAARGRASRVRVFTVGLRSRAFRARPLERLAKDTGATYAEAPSSADLERIFDTLGRRLSAEYVLDYRSRAHTRDHVSVRVEIAGVGSAEQHYVAPQPNAISPFHRSPFAWFWSSPASLFFLVLMIASLAALAAVAVVRTPRSTLMTRIGEFVSVAVPAEKRNPKLLSARLVAQTEKSLARTKWWERFNEELEIARISIPAAHIVVGTVVATLLAAIVLALISPIFVVLALGIPFLAHALVYRKLNRTREEFAEQLPDNLQVLASALRAGHSFIGALAVVAQDAPEPAQREFRRIVADDQLGVPIDDSLRQVARRMASVELDQVALLAELQRESGGNMSEVLDTIVETIRDRFDLRRLVQTLTAQGRLARWILTLLPAFLAFAITLLNPAYTRPLFDTTAGQVLLGLAIGMVVAGSLVIKKIVNIKV